MNREFDLYYVIDEEGDISCESICENKEQWVPGRGWAEPNVHVIEYSAYESLHSEKENLEKALEEAKKVISSLSERHLWHPLLGECICDKHQDAKVWLDKYGGDK